jgi:hypothetical protein
MFGEKSMNVMYQRFTIEHLSVVQVVVVQVVVVQVVVVQVVVVQVVVVQVVVVVVVDVMKEVDKTYSSTTPLALVGSGCERGVHVQDVLILRRLEAAKATTSYWRVITIFIVHHGCVWLCDQ